MTLHEAFFFTKGKIKELEAILDMRQLPDNIQSILQTR